MKMRLTASNLEALKTEVACIIEDVLADGGEMHPMLEEMRQVLDEATWVAPFYYIEADTELMEQIEEIMGDLGM